MKKLLVINRNCVIPDLSEKFDVYDSGNIEYMDAIVLWNDAVGDNRMIALQAKEMGKPVFIVQHGFYSSPHTEYGENKVTPTGAHHFLWSDYHSQLFQADGVDEKNITITGSTIYRYFRNHVSDGKTVVFAPTHVGQHEPNEMNALQAEKIWGKLLEIPGINPIAKLVAGEHTRSNFAGQVVASSLTALNHLPAISQLLSRAACVVVQDESTFAFLAHAAGVPVVKIKNHYEPFSDACHLSEMDDIKDSVPYAISNPDDKKENRKEITLKMGGDPQLVQPIQAIEREINARLVEFSCV